MQKENETVFTRCWLEKEERMFVVSGEYLICTRCSYRMKRKPNEKVVKDFIPEEVEPDIEHNEYTSEYLKHLKGDEL